MGKEDEMGLEGRKMNMKRKLLHTPEGVRDIYNDECEKKMILQDSLHHAMKEYGYHTIQTPTFEFFDIFGKEIGTTPSKELYKFFDREGNTLVLRPDITPSIARSAAKYFMDEDMPIRLCYLGNTFINNNSYQGRLKESTQLGAELIGDKSIDADAEILALATECLLRAGLTDFQLSVGHVDFLEGLVEAAGLEENEILELRDLIANKNFFGVEELVEGFHLNPELSQLFAMLGKFYDGTEELVLAKSYAKDYPKILHALIHLEELQKVLEVYGIEKYISYELGVISHYEYYTGIIFAGYTFGTGEAIVKGGRYDELLTHFGKDSASIGFAIVVDQLMAALSRQKIDIPVAHQNVLIVYEDAQKTNAIQLAMQKRKDGRNVELIRKDTGKTNADYEAYALRNHLADVIYL